MRIPYVCRAFFKKCDQAMYLVGKFYSYEGVSPVLKHLGTTGYTHTHPEELDCSLGGTHSAGPLVSWHGVSCSILPPPKRAMRDVSYSASEPDS